MVIHQDLHLFFYDGETVNQALGAVATLVHQSSFASGEAQVLDGGLATCLVLQRLAGDGGVARPLASVVVTEGRFLVAWNRPGTPVYARLFAD